MLLVNETLPELTATAATHTPTTASKAVMAMIAFLVLLVWFGIKLYWFIHKQHLQVS